MQKLCIERRKRGLKVNVKKKEVNKLKIKMKNKNT